MEASESMYPQVCDRQYGEETCLIHSGCKVTHHCNECKMLVCSRCIQSPVHQGDTFTELKTCLGNMIATRIEQFDYSDKVIDSALSTIGEEIITSHKESEFKENDSNLTVQIKKQFKRYYDTRILCQRNYETLLRANKNIFPQKRQKYMNVMESGSDIMRYDTGVQQSKEKIFDIQTKPSMPMMANVKYISNILIIIQNKTNKISKAYTELRWVLPWVMSSIL